MTERISQCILCATRPGVTTSYLFSGGQVIAEYAGGAAPGSPTVEYIYGPRGELLASIQGGTPTYHLRDHLSVRVNASPTGSKIGEQGHYPYGESWYSSGTTTKWQFTNYERDSESGNDYAIARHYINRLGRFFSPDPVDGNSAAPQTLDLYAYVAADPIDNIDPDGRIAVSASPCGGGGGDPGNPFGTPPFFPGGGFPWPVWWPGNGPLAPTPPFFPANWPGASSASSSSLFSVLSLFFQQGLCRGTTDCSYYSDQCKKANTASSRRYYCVGAPLVCKTAGRWRLANCIRLCLQEGDRCLNMPDVQFNSCQEWNHGFCYTFCGVAIGEGVAFADAHAGTCFAYCQASCSVANRLLVAKKRYTHRLA